MPEVEILPRLLAGFPVHDDIDHILPSSANPDGWMPLHPAAGVLHVEGVACLLDHAADPNRRANDNMDPIDVAPRTAELGALSAVALGDAD